MLTAKLSALLLLLSSAATMAQGVPSRSIELFCAKRANAAGAALENLFTACVEAERASLADLIDNWTDYDPQSRAQCVSIMGKGGLYSDLQACIESAEAVRARPAK
jgi:hypothetical protein